MFCTKTPVFFSNPRPSFSPGPLREPEIGVIMTLTGFILPVKVTEQGFREEQIMNAYLASVLENVRTKHGNEPEFVQTVEEVFPPSSRSSKSTLSMRR